MAATAACAPASSEAAEPSTEVATVDGYPACAASDGGASVGESESAADAAAASKSPAPTARDARQAEEQAETEAETTEQLAGRLREQMMEAVAAPITPRGRFDAEPLV
jgi:hypothetical protein